MDVGGRGVRLAGEVLHVLDRDALGQQVGHDHHPKAVRGDGRRQSGILQAPLENAPADPRPAAARPEPCGGVVVGAAEERRLLRIVTDPGRLDVLGNPAGQFAPKGDLPPLPSLLPVTEGEVLAVVAEILKPELGHGSNACAGVGEGAEHGTIAQADRPGAVDGREQLPGLLNRDLGCLATCRES